MNGIKSRLLAGVVISLAGTGAASAFMAPAGQPGGGHGWSAGRITVIAAATGNNSQITGSTGPISVNQVSGPVIAYSGWGPGFAVLQGQGSGTTGGLGVLLAGGVTVNAGSGGMGGGLVNVVTSPVATSPVVSGPVVSGPVATNPGGLNPVITSPVGGGTIGGVGLGGTPVNVTTGGGSAPGVTTPNLGVAGLGAPNLGTTGLGTTGLATTGVSGATSGLSGGSPSINPVAANPVSGSGGLATVSPTGAIGLGGLAVPTLATSGTLGANPSVAVNGSLAQPLQTAAGVSGGAGGPPQTGGALGVSTAPSSPATQGGGGLQLCGGCVAGLSGGVGG